MNATRRRNLQLEPVPMESTGLAIACVVFEKNQWRTAWLVGNRKTVFGEPYTTAKDAIAAATYLNEVNS